MCVSGHLALSYVRNQTYLFKWYSKPCNNYNTNEAFLLLILNRTNHRLYTKCQHIEYVITGNAFCSLHAIITPHYKRNYMITSGLITLVQWTVYFHWRDKLKACQIVLLIHVITHWPIQTLKGRRILFTQTIAYLTY